MNNREIFFLILANYINVSVDIIDESNTFDKLGIDSMDAVDVVMQVEEKFNIEVGDADLASFIMVGDALTYIENKLSTTTQTEGSTNMPTEHQENTVNETELREIVHSSIVAQKITMDGNPITKKIIDDILDTTEELLFKTIASGKGIKMQNFMTLEVRDHKATVAHVPTTQNEDGSWEFQTVDVPAGKHVGVIASDKLKKYMNPSDIEGQ